RPSQPRNNPEDAVVKCKSSARCKTKGRIEFLRVWGWKRNFLLRLFANLSLHLWKEIFLFPRFLLTV
ncbi:hypothetical protein AVEN_43245-2-1, partial [Araneus ventricosus]